MAKLKMKPKKPASKQDAAPRTAADAVIDAVRKAHPKIHFSRASEWEKTRIRYSTGFLGLDVKTGGGLCGGRIHQYAGKTRSCKTSAAYHACATAQQTLIDPRILWLHTEPFEKDWARRCGVQIAYDDVEIKMLEQRNGKPFTPAEKVELKRQVGTFQNMMSTTDHEDLLEAGLDALRTGDYHLFVVDSIGALHPNVWEEKTLGEPVQMGRHAMMVKRWAKKLENVIARKRVAVLALNHVRSDMDTHALIFPGGVDWGHYVDLNVVWKQDAWIHPASKKKDDEEDAPPETTERPTCNAEDEAVGQLAFWKIDKTKIGGVRSSFGRVRFYFQDYGKFKAGDWDLVRDALDTGVEVGVIDARGGGNYYIAGTETKLGRGMDDVRAYVERNPAFMRKLYDTIAHHLAVQSVASPKVSASRDEEK